MEFKILLVLFIFWVTFIPISLSRVAEKISLLGVYHAIETEGNIRKELSIFREKEKEGIISKILKVYYTHISLTMPFLFAYYLVIDSALDLKNIGPYDVFCLSFITTLASLLSIRVLANIIGTVDRGVYKLYPETERLNVRKINQERIISFFHSFVCGSLLILGIILSSNIISSNVISNTDFIKTDLSDFKFFETFTFLCYYFGLLLIFTIIIEIFYYHCPPWTCIKQTEKVPQTNEVKQTEEVSKTEKVDDVNPSEQRELFGETQDINKEAYQLKPHTKTR